MNSDSLTAYVNYRFWSEAKFCYEEWRAQLGNDEIIPKSMPPWLYIDKIIRV